MIGGDDHADAAAIVVAALESLPWPVHHPPFTAAIAPPCLIVEPAIPVEDGSAIGCPWWRYNVVIVAVASDTTAKDLADIGTATMRRLWEHGMRSTATLAQYAQDSPVGQRPAALPAYRITAT